MLETLLERPFFLKRHHDAPLLEERQSFLHHLQQQGTSRVALRRHGIRRTRGMISSRLLQCGYGSDTDFSRSR